MQCVGLMSLCFPPNDSDLNVVGVSKASMAIRSYGTTSRNWLKIKLGELVLLQG